MSIRPLMFAIVMLAPSCDSENATPVGDTGLFPGEVCDRENSATLRVRFDPPQVVVAPGQSRPVEVSVDPDLCTPATLSLRTADGAIADAPKEAKLDLRHPSFSFVVHGRAVGGTSLTASITRDDGTTGTETLPIEVRDAAPPTCATGASGSARLDVGNPSASALGATLSTPKEAFARTDAFKLPAFDAQIACDTDIVPPAGFAKLGPAVRFMPTRDLDPNEKLRREMAFAIPVNPAAMPSGARLRHVKVFYRHERRAKEPRSVLVADARIEKVTGTNDYVFKFSAPWFGTYQVAVDAEGGQKKVRRRLAHRAVIGFSMGGGGAAAFGLRHHNKFDAVGPLGGPSDWTWLLWYIEKYAMGGFCPKGETNCTKYKPGEYPITDPFAHSMDWNHWYYEPGSGNGGTFDRESYVQIFEDLALARGNPVGENPLTHFSFAAGPRPPGGSFLGDPWVTGDKSVLATSSLNLDPAVDCRYAVEPIENDPQAAEQAKILAHCKRSRCDASGTWKAPNNYFDDEFNPDGTEQVISFCDGSPQTGESPYLNTWTPLASGQGKPVNLALAVDLNRNGVRDENEPIIRSGHEPFDDCGTDGLCNTKEPGFDPVTNPDPNQDDYDYQINPGGTEGDHRYQKGEPFRDDGLDGVPNTASKHVAGDVGEGDGQYTETTGYRNFYATDAHSMLRRWSEPAVSAGALTDDALRRIDILSDGGVRDLFNFSVVASHLTGAIASRRRADGQMLRSVGFYNGFEYLPGQDTARPTDFAPGNIRWADMPDMPSVRFGNIDASAVDISRGDGQHVGTVGQILYRLELGFYFAAQRWPDADRTLTLPSLDNPGTTTKNELGIDCEVAGKCRKDFKGPITGRKGPILVSLPPGYALKENIERNVRYPVLYVLHGYGQTPEGLDALAVIFDNFMTNKELSAAHRLPKFIVVYVDGRCRLQETTPGKFAPECIRGNFYLDSVRPLPHLSGAGAKNELISQADSWFEEVMDYVDQNYRTMPATDVDWVE